MYELARVDYLLGRFLQEQLPIPVSCCLHTFLQRLAERGRAS